MNPQRNKSRFILFGVIFTLHCALILGPLGFNALMSGRQQKKDIAFRVKLGGFEPSHAPEAGMPERKRPSPAPPAPTPPKKQVPPKKTNIPKPVKPKSKPKPKQKTKQTKPAPKPKPKQKTKNATAKKVNQKNKNRQKTIKKEKPKTPEVFHDSSWDNFNPNAAVQNSGGQKFNRNVPIGSRDRGQKIGKADHRTPAGGATEDEEKYWEELDKFLTEKWERPPGVLVTSETAVIIGLSVSADGRVLEKRIVKRSPNPAVNLSAELMLKNLNIIPRPPRGAVEFQIKLVSE